MSKGKKKKNPENSDTRKREMERYERELKRELISKVVLMSVLAFAPLILFIVFFSGLDRYTFVNVEFFPLWYVALALGVVYGLLFVIYMVGKEHGIWKKILVFAVMTAIACLGFGSLFAHLNHWFDTSEPIRYEVVIEDKDEIRRRKSLDRYEFTFTLNGETFDVNVPWSDYRNYKEGDTYVVEYHEGAFGEPYFMSVGWSKYLPELPPPAQEPIEE